MPTSNLIASVRSPLIHESVREGLAQIRYHAHIRGSAVTVSYCDSEADYSVAVEKTFAKFKQGAVKVWVPETPHTSRDLLILVKQSTEPVAPLDSVRLACRPPGEWS